MRFAVQIRSMGSDATNTEIRGRAIASMEEHEWREALEIWEVWFKETLDEEHDPNSFHDRAICKFHTGAKELAIVDLNSAAILQPDYSYRFASRGWMKQAVGDIDGAILDYKHAIELDPEDSIAFNNLGLLEEQKGYKFQAEERFQVADELAKMLKEEEVAEVVEVVEVVPVPKVVKNRLELEPDRKKTLIEVIISLFTEKHTRKLWWKFIRHGFKMKD